MFNNLHIIKLTNEEVFEIHNLLHMVLKDGDEDIKSAYKKFNKIEMPMVEVDLNYEIPEFKPTEGKSK